MATTWQAAKKLYGVSVKKQGGLADAKESGKIEFTCANIARQTGIRMLECWLQNVGGRNYFKTKCLDRDRY